MCTGAGMTMIKRVVVGELMGIGLPLLRGPLFILLGGMPVTTKDAPLPFERYLAKKALKAAMRKEIGTRAPMPPDDTSLLAGAKVYREQCAVCHGLPNQPLGAIAKGMFPPPPALFSPDEGVTDDPEGKMYWKVKHGIRLTGMPGFQESLSEMAIWQ